MFSSPLDPCNAAFLSLCGRPQGTHLERRLPAHRRAAWGASVPAVPGVGMCALWNEWRDRRPLWKGAFPLTNVLKGVPLCLLSQVCGGRGGGPVADQAALSLPRAFVHTFPPLGHTFPPDCASMLCMCMHHKHTGGSWLGPVRCFAAICGLCLTPLTTCCLRQMDKGQQLAHECACRDTNGHTSNG